MSHPITPPLAKVHEWMRQWNADHLNQGDQLVFVSAKAAQSGQQQSDADTEAQGPSNEELLELMPETMRDEFSYAAKTCSDATGGQVKPGIFRVCLNTAALEYARAVLAKWGYQ